VLTGTTGFPQDVVQLSHPKGNAFPVQVNVHLVDPARHSCRHRRDPRFQRGETAGTRALFVLSGLASVAFGILLFSRPGVGAVTLALLFGLYSLIYGFAQITAGIQVRHLGGSLGSLTELRNAA
jgi:hypothetical protein